ncbi:hypothetical protein VNO77_03686 [Canavalia gladiata]|uniref:Uncharacterized protein n=1 Tax=Canavalia gladiata TaxID=3824 RepID=A0AAN9MX69_CANGL
MDLTGCRMVQMYITMILLSCMEISRVEWRIGGATTPEHAANGSMQNGIKVDVGPISEPRRYREFQLVVLLGESDFARELFERKLRVDLITASHVTRHVPLFRPCIIFFSFFLCMNRSSLLASSFTSHRGFLGLEFDSKSWGSSFSLLPYQSHIAKNHEYGVDHSLSVKS